MKPLLVAVGLSLSPFIIVKGMISKKKCKRVALFSGEEIAILNVYLE